LHAVLCDLFDEAEAEVWKDGATDRVWSGRTQKHSRLAGLAKIAECNGWIRIGFALRCSGRGRGTLVLEDEAMETAEDDDQER
jgi:hypothetical protein